MIRQLPHQSNSLADGIRGDFNGFLPNSDGKFCQCGLISIWCSWTFFCSQGPDTLKKSGAFEEKLAKLTFG